MHPFLWGPGLWHILFVCAWSCRRSDVGTLKQLVMVYAPLLLPCPKCRAHYVKNHPRATSAAGGEPSTAEDVFKWLYHLKHEVNRTLRAPSIPFADLTQRFAVHEGRVDSILVADTVLLLALGLDHAGTNDPEPFRAFCRCLAQLLPLPDDSNLLAALLSASADGGASRNPVASAYLVYKSTRVEHGFPRRRLAELRELATAEETRRR